MFLKVKNFFLINFPGQDISISNISNDAAESFFDNLGSVNTSQKLSSRDDAARKSQQDTKSTGVDESNDKIKQPIVQGGKTVPPKAKKLVQQVPGNMFD